MVCCYFFLLYIIDAICYDAMYTDKVLDISIIQLHYYAEYKTRSIDLFELKYAQTQGPFALIKRTLAYKKHEEHKKCSESEFDSA